MSSQIWGTRMCSKNLLCATSGGEVPQRQGVAGGEDQGPSEPESGPSRIARDRSDRRCWSWRRGRCRRRALTSPVELGPWGPFGACMALGTFSRMARGEAGRPKNALRTPQDEEETLKRSYCRASFRSRLPATRFGGPSPSFLGSCSWPLMARPRPLMSHGS